MMNIKTIYIFLFNILFAFQLYSQSNLLNADDPSEIGIKNSSQLDLDDEAFLEYGIIDDKDILFSKVVWETIDLSERLNFPFLYPTIFESVGKERRPLAWYLIEGIKSGKITKIYADGKFNIKLSKEDVIDKLSDSIIRPGGRKLITQGGGYVAFLTDNGVDIGEYAGIDEDSLARVDRNAMTKMRKDLENLAIPILNNTRGAVSINEFTYRMVTGFKVKGVWYFDKIQSDLRYRPIAIAPVTQQVGNVDDESDDPSTWETIPLFWIYYPDARESLKNAYVFSDKNSSVRKSFDELINARRFNSVIYLEENMYQDREVKDYYSNNAFMRLLESERIKEKIRNLEHDMWSW